LLLYQGEFGGTFIFYAGVKSREEPVAGNGGRNHFPYIISHFSFAIDGFSFAIEGISFAIDGFSAAIIRLLEFLK